MTTTFATSRKTKVVEEHSSSRGYRSRDPHVSSFLSPVIHRKSSCACGGGCPACQAKSSDLKISQPNDPAEIEADAIADRVMRMSIDDAKPKVNSTNGSSSIHRKCDACEEENEELTETAVMRKEAFSSVTPTPPPSDTPPSIKNALNSGGRPLDLQTRRFFEPRFDTDLSQVSIHTDSAAAQSARSINARAYTLGNNIVFGQGHYDPPSELGKQLIAHELAHVSQVATGRVRRQTIHRQPDKRDKPAKNKRPVEGFKQFVQSDLIREIKINKDSWTVTIDGFFDPDSAKRMLWPKGVPAGIQVELEAAITDPIERGWFTIRGITFESVKSMEPSVAKMFSDKLLDSYSTTGTITDPRTSPRYIDNLFDSVSYDAMGGVTTFKWTENGAKKFIRIPFNDLMQDESKSLTPNFKVFSDRAAAKADVYQYSLYGAKDLYTFYKADGNVIMPTLFSRQTAPNFHALWPGLRQDLAKQAKDIQKGMADIGNAINPIPGTELDEEGNLSISTNPLSWLPLVFHIAPHVKLRGGTPDLPTIKTDPGHGSKPPPDVAPPPAKPAPPMPVDTTAPPKPVDTPAPPKPVDTPAPPKPLDTPAPPKPVDTPAPAKPVDTPTPAKPVDTPAPKPADQPTATPPKVADEPAVPPKSKQALEQAKAINEGKIAELDQKILKHETKKKELFDKATRIENERATSDFRDKAAKAKQQAVNEGRLADQARAERGRLAAENKKIADEINPPPAPKIGPGPGQPHGGAHKDIPTAGGEVNHIPPDSVTKIPYDKGPAIWMEKGDHLQTNSWGNRNFKPTQKYPYSSASEWRAAQKELIKKGKIRQAIQMDIDDIRSKFGSKYDKGIEQMLEYIKTLKPGEF